MPAMMISLLFTIIKFIVSISLIVSIHELGHLFFAKLFGIKVEEYMVGMPPKIWGIKKGETFYGIGAVPLGGYVKITGFGIDSIEEKSKKTARSYHKKSAWKKLFVLLGGVFFNFSTSILIFATIFSTVGHDYIPYSEQLKHGIHPSEIGKKLGFKEGDHLISLNGKEFDDMIDFYKQLSPNTHNRYILKDMKNNKRELVLTPYQVNELLSSQQPLFQVRFPYKIKKVIKGSLAERIGLKSGDVLISICGVSVRYMRDLKKFLSERSIPDRGEMVWQREKKLHSATFTKKGAQKYGLSFEPLLVLKKKKIKNPFTSIAKSFRQSSSFLYQQLDQIQLLVRGKGSLRASISGPIGIASLFSEVSSWELLFFLIALLSLMIGFMNVLPIPGLDGFHVMLLLIELVRGRPFKKNTQLKIQKFTSFFFLALIFLICINDLAKILLS